MIKYTQDLMGAAGSGVLNRFLRQHLTAQDKPDADMIASAVVALGGMYVSELIPAVDRDIAKGVMSGSVGYLTSRLYERVILAEGVAPAPAPAPAPAAVWYESADVFNGSEKVEESYMEI